MPRTYGTTNAAPYAAAPPVGPSGDTYWNTTSKIFYISDGTNWVASAGGGGGGGTAAYVQTITAPTVAGSPYAIIHNLNFGTPLVQIWDSTGTLVLAKVTVAGLNQVNVAFSQNPPGNVTVVVTTGGMGPPAPSAIAPYVTTLGAPTTVGSPYTVTHSLGTSTPLVELWDAVTGQLIFGQVSVVSANQIAVSFAANPVNNVIVVVSTGGMGPAGPAAANTYNLVYYQSTPALTVATSPRLITHTLNSTYVLVQLWDSVTGQLVEAQVRIVDATHISLSVAQDMPNAVNVVITAGPASPAPIVPADWATKSYVDARTPNLPSPITSGSGIQSFTDALGDVWVAANGVYGGAWKRARDVLHCRVARAAAYTFPATSAALLIHDQTVRDTYGLYSAGYFTAPIAGLYLVGGKAAFTATALGNTCNTQLAVNGSLWAYLCGVIAPAAGGVHMPYGSPLIPIAAGDTLSVSVLAFSGGPLNGIVGNSQTYLNIDYMGTG